jgi:hypothetical protein
MQANNCFGSEADQTRAQHPDCCSHHDRLHASRGGIHLLSARSSRPAFELSGHFNRESIDPPTILSRLKAEQGNSV